MPALGRRMSLCLDAAGVRKSPQQRTLKRSGRQRKPKRAPTLGYSLILCFLPELLLTEECYWLCLADLNRPRSWRSEISDRSKLFLSAIMCAPSRGMERRPCPHPSFADANDTFS